MMLTKIIAACFLLVVFTEAILDIKPVPDVVSLGNCKGKAHIGDDCKKGKGTCQTSDNAECEAGGSPCRLQCMTKEVTDGSSKSSGSRDHSTSGEKSKNKSESGKKSGKQDGSKDHSTSGKKSKNKSESGKKSGKQDGSKDHSTSGKKSKNNSESGKKSGNKDDDSNSECEETGFDDEIDMIGEKM